jgi:hypothetical protein
LPHEESGIEEIAATTGPITGSEIWERRYGETAKRFQEWTDKKGQ